MLHIFFPYVWWFWRQFKKKKIHATHTISKTVYWRIQDYFEKKTYPSSLANYKKSLSVVKCYVLTQCSMTINVGSAANSSSVLQEFCRSMQDSKVNVDVENGPPLGPILSRMNGSSSSSQFEIRFNIIPQQLCLQVLPTKNLHALLSYPYNMPRTLLPLSFDHR